MLEREEGPDPRACRGAEHKVHIDSTYSIPTVACSAEDGGETIEELEETVKWLKSNGWPCEGPEELLAERRKAKEEKGLSLEAARAEARRLESEARQQTARVDRLRSQLAEAELSLQEVSGRLAKAKNTEREILAQENAKAGEYLPKKTITVNLEAEDDALPHAELPRDTLDLLAQFASDAGDAAAILPRPPLMQEHARCTAAPPATLEDPAREARHAARPMSPEPSPGVRSAPSAPPQHCGAVAFRVCGERVEVPAVARRCPESLLWMLVGSHTAVPIARNSAGEVEVADTSSVAAFRLLAHFVAAEVDDAPAVFERFGGEVLACADVEGALTGLRFDAEYFLGSSCDVDLDQFMGLMQHWVSHAGHSLGSLLWPSQDLLESTRKITRPSMAALQKLGHGCSRGGARSR